MKNLLRFFTFLFVGIVVIGLAVYLIPDQYMSSYQRALVRQYDYCKSIDENKIVFVGNSSLSFGLDLDLMEELTGKPCAIIGNHAGYGMTYPLEMAKSTLKEGDIVVIEINNSSINSVGADLLLTGIGKRYDLYQYLLPNLWNKVIKAYPAYVKRTIEHWLNRTPPDSGPYSIDAYDERGNMIYDRPTCLIPEPYTGINGYVGYGAFEMEPAFQQYLQEYVNDCAELNIPVYFAAICIMDEAVTSTLEDADKCTESWKQQLPAPFVSAQRDYIFPRKYIYDVIFHCNTEGAKYRTELLYYDLELYLT